MRASCRTDKNGLTRCPWHDVSLSNPWAEEIHPWLASLARSGKEVHLFAGDSSMNAAYEIDGVRFYSTGIRANDPVWDWFDPDLLEFLKVRVGPQGLQVEPQSVPRGNS